MTTLPGKLDDAIKAAVVLLEGQLRATYAKAKTHEFVVVEGWSQSAVMITAVATCLVGLLATAISQTLEVRSQLEDTQDDRLELGRTVERLTGTAGNTLSNDQKEDERNPWIAEGLWHLCLFLGRRLAGFHPVGTIVALDFPHISAKDHGLDVLAIYRADTLFGVSFVESKAYANDPNKAINRAVAYFKEIDEGRHDARIRQVVASMRSGMTPADQASVSPSLWKQDRAYIPNPHYDDTTVVDWTNTRSSFGQLRVRPERIVVMPHAVPNFAQFFDDVAAAMLAFVGTL